MNRLAHITEAVGKKRGRLVIDPTVFFRLSLVGYLENIISDGQLVQHASMRLDILYFFDYDIDDELPWHSTGTPSQLVEPETHSLMLCSWSYLKRCLACVSTKGWLLAKPRPSIQRQSKQMLPWRAWNSKYPKKSWKST